MQQEKPRWASIRIDPGTRELLRRLGHKGETYDQIIRLVLRKAGLDQEVAEPTAPAEEERHDPANR